MDSIQNRAPGVKCPCCGGTGFVPTATATLVPCPDPDCDVDLGSQPFWFPDDIDSEWEAEFAAHRAAAEGKVA